MRDTCSFHAGAVHDPIGLDGPDIAPPPDPIAKREPISIFDVEQVSRVERDLSASRYLLKSLEDIRGDPVSMDVPPRQSVAQKPASFGQRQTLPKRLSLADAGRP